MKENNQEDMNNGTCNGCKNCGAGCTCGGMHGYHGHPVLRIVLALVIIAFVFIAGMKLGELKAELGMAYQYQGMMMSQGGYGEMRMMMDNQQNDMPVMIPATTAPADGTTPATQ